MACSTVFPDFEKVIVPDLFIYFFPWSFYLGSGEGGGGQMPG